MAGITNAAYRQLCRESAEQGTAARPAGLFVCEMITSRGIVEGDPKTLSMLQFDPGEQVRSVQLYGVDAAVMGRATAILCEQYAVGHVDLNFGCPVPKVTRKGGGAVLPWKRDRLRAILRATVGAAAPFGVPVTMKTRIGIDASHLTYLDAGRIAEESGCAAIALHGRTAEQAYAGHADWDAIGSLKQSVDIPVLGNGDIWEAADAVRMVEQTGVDGVVVGRGCLGRPWLFRDLAAALSALSTERALSLSKGTGPGPSTEPVLSLSKGSGRIALPDLSEVAATVRRHGELLAGIQGEEHGCKDLRKHMAWYFKGFPVGGELRRSLAMVASLAELDDLLGRLPEAPFPDSELGKPRGRQGSPRGRVVIPQGWLDDTSGLDLDLGDAELGISGG
ncbi:tRNA dihydrouridine synthase [Microlunatus ginsengisoli]|uniref:tRNA-dihydrouridine synthase n=1 Tax=Microlunatus ginsengisoli TaxID=363863 RepID=A0ABP6ZQB4_9ACTN